MTDIARLLSEEAPSVPGRSPAPRVANDGQLREGRRSLEVLAWRSSLVFVSLCAGIALRLLYLDADPYYYEWIGYITDEGRCAIGAKH